jgi:UDP-glucose 4-epimerase
MILVTGGLGYIGSHTCVALLRAGYSLTIVDNLVNSKIAVLERIRELGGGNPEFHKADLRDEAALAATFKRHSMEAVIHFAGLKAVGESVAKPLEYYENNLGGTFVLLKTMERFGVRRIVFSSSATAYGDPQRLPLREDHPLAAVNPYGRTKQFIESVLADVALAKPGFRHATLRYFNPVGAHPSGRMGEDPRGIPNNLFPYVTQVAIGRLPKLRVFGNDYETVDGTGVRDYIHVMDLADGHVAALVYLLEKDRSITVNLGTGRGNSVLELIAAFERVTGINIPREIALRRPGDVASCYADASLAKRELGWQARFGIDDMCRDAWAWQKANPEGYPD